MAFPAFQVLDSVDPDAVRDAMQRSATTLFLLASKSGSSIELASLAAEAKRRVRAAAVIEPGSHFVAITDDNTVLQRQAISQRFRDLFINPSDIGGRFSALSLFGLVPAAVMGIDIDARWLQRLPVPEPSTAVEGARIVLTTAAEPGLGDGTSLALLDLLRPGDYFALLAYLPPDDERFMPTLEGIRSSVAERTGCAVTLGFGPR